MEGRSVDVARLPAFGTGHLDVPAMLTNVSILLTGIGSRTTIPAGR